MDVYGKAPANASGEYFRSTVWYWGPLWSYVETVAPTICVKVDQPYMNVGSGLTEPDSSELGEIIQQEIDSGRTEKYAERHQERKDVSYGGYCFSVEHVTKFATFLKNCGGFEIW